jgi:hypothetical protein
MTSDPTGFPQHKAQLEKVTAEMLINYKDPAKKNAHKSGSIETNGTIKMQIHLDSTEQSKE